MSAEYVLFGLLCVGSIVLVGLLFILPPRFGRPKTGAGSTLADDIAASETNQPLADDRPKMRRIGQLTDEERRRIEEDLKNAG